MILGDLKLKLEENLKRLKLEVGTIYFAYKHKATPWFAKILAAVVVGYALSPVDLIPDFIPILGYLDDMILLPLGIALVIKLIPNKIVAEAREEAKLHFANHNKSNWFVGLIIVFIWIIIIASIGYHLANYLYQG